MIVCVVISTVDRMRALRNLIALRFSAGSLVELRQFGTFSRCGCDGHGESDCHIATRDHASASRVNKPSPRLRLSGIAAVDGSLNSAATLQRSSLIRRYVEWTVREIKTCRQSASPRSPKVLLAWHSPPRLSRSESALRTWGVAKGRVQSFQPLERCASSNRWDTTDWCRLGHRFIRFIYAALRQ